MHVIRGIHRQIVIHHKLDAFDIDAARSDVGRHQDAIAPCFKSFESLAPLTERAVAMNFGGAVSHRADAAENLFCAVLGTRKDERRAAVITEDLFEQAQFFVLAHDEKFWLTRSEVVPEGATSIRVGSFICRVANSIISFESVAEKSIVCRAVGTRVMMRLICGQNPMSSMRSASSRTRIATWSSRMVFCSRWSRSRPGVAMTMCGSRRSPDICGPIEAPPI